MKCMTKHLIKQHIKLRDNDKKKHSDHLLTEFLFSCFLFFRISTGVQAFVKEGISLK
jgi:hypothetical protein